MTKKWLLAMILSMSSLSAGCSVWDGIRGCPDGQIDWADVLMINDIKYGSDIIQEQEKTHPETGDSLGKVTYMLDGNACSSHKLKNDEATYVSAGTLGDLADIQGKVTKISIRSDEDDTLLGELDTEQTEAFLKEYLALDYEGNIDPKNESDRENRVFIYFQLEDGSTFHTIYVIDENIFGYEAYGNEKTKRIIEAVVKE